MVREEIHPGQYLIWEREERGGYGYISRIPVSVIRVGPARILVEARLTLGGMRRVWVKPEKLRNTL